MKPVGGASEPAEDRAGERTKDRRLRVTRKLPSGARQPDLDLPGYSLSQQIETLGLLEVEKHLSLAGFKSMRVTGQFDDGIDLLVSPHDGQNVLPAIAGIQVKSGASYGKRLPVGRHQRYWRELNLPVFGVVLRPSGQGMTGGWVNAQAYLRRHKEATSIPMEHSFPEGLGAALRAAAAHQRAEAVALDVFSDDPRRQATAVVSLTPFADEVEVSRLLAAGLGRLGAAACHWAVQLLAFRTRVAKREHSEEPTVSLDALVRAADLMYDFDFDEFDAGVQAVYGLFESSGVDPQALVGRALRDASAEGVVLLLAMAISLAGPGGSQVLVEALRQRPNLRENPDIRNLAEVVHEGQYSFVDGF